MARSRQPVPTTAEADLASTILKDVLASGAIPLDFLNQRGTDRPSVGERLIGCGWLVGVPTPEGMGYVLSPRAKQWLGVHSTWITRPQLAARQLLLRKLDPTFRRRGWLRAAGSLPYPCYRTRAGRLIYVTASRTTLRPAVVRRILDRSRELLLREGAVLVVLSPSWRQLQGIATRSNGLLTAEPLEPLDMQEERSR